MARDYDPAGRLSAVTDWLGHRTGFGYDPDSDLTRVTYPNGAQSVRGYDRTGRQTSVADSSLLAGTFLNFGYGRDPAGRVSSEGSKTFGYDQNDRLKSQSEGPAVSYGYDLGDNPTSATVAGGPAKTLSYDPAHQLSTMSTTSGGTTTATYSYDGNGNRTSDGAGGAYTYDQVDRLTAYNAATYAYDGDGLRTKKTTSSGVRAHTWDLAQGLPLMIGDGSTAYITGPDGLPLEQITSPGVARYYHQANSAPPAR